MKNDGLAYVFQAALISFWWIGIIQFPEFYKYFEFNGISRELFTSFLVPDFVVISFLSLLLGYRSLNPVKFIILGGFLYATIFCFSVTFTLGGGQLSSAVMLLGTAYNAILCFKTDSFRQSLHNKPWINLGKTIIQIVLVWSIFLVVIPFFILKIESKIPLVLKTDLTSLIAILLFVLFSAVGLWSGFVMSTQGKGTPLPVDATKKLVISGPYKFVRNPMAICGIGQGMSIGLYTRSVPIFLYCLLGIFVWHYVVRKYEEQDLESRFGDTYRHYKQAVKCWLPNLKGYSKNSSG